MAKPAVVGGVTVTHPERVVYPIERLTKFDIVRYYGSVADRMLPHLVGRPLTLVACMTGIARRLPISPPLESVGTEGDSPCAHPREDQDR